MEDEFDIFADDDPLVALIKRGRVHQVEEAARQDEEARERKQAEVVGTFRNFLLDEYDDELLVLTERSLSAATERSYNDDIAHFVRWCAEVSELAEFEFRPWPAAPETVAFYLYLQWREAGASSSALKRKFAALGFAHRTKNLVYPCRAAYPDGAEGEMFVDWKPFPAAVLMRTRRQEQKAKEGE